MKKIKELMEESMKRLEALIKPENVRISEAIVEQLKSESNQVEIESKYQCEEIEIELELDGALFYVYAEVEINSSIGDHSAYPYEERNFGAEIDEVVFESAYCEGHDDLKLTEEAIETIQDSIY